MGFNVESYIDKVDNMTIRELEAEKNQLNREWSNQTTKQYAHLFSSVLTGPFGLYKGFKAGSRGIEAAQKSAIVDARLEDLEAYTHSRKRDFVYGGGAALALKALGDVAGEGAESLFHDIDHDHTYEFGENLACKGIEECVEKGGEKLMGTAFEGRAVNVGGLTCFIRCDGCFKVRSLLHLPTRSLGLR
jgi:hypothetical protein